MYKKIALYVARLVRNDALKHSDNVHTKALLASMVSRSVIDNDYKLASRLVATSPFCAEHLDISANRTLQPSVRLVSPVRFRGAYETVVSAAYRADSAEHERHCPLRPRVARQAQHALNARLRVVCPFKRSKTIHSILVDDNEILFDNAVGELIKYWAPKSAAPSSSLPPGASEYAATHLSHLDLSSADAPLPSAIDAFLKRSPNSSVGLDRIPYSAYRNETGIRLLYDCFWDMACGCPPPAYFNATRVFFIAKGQLSSDTLRVSRPPSKTRQIGLRNTDAKIIYAAAARALMPLLSTQSAPCQRGGLTRRKFVNGVLDIDTDARIAQLCNFCSSPPLCRSLTSCPDKFPAICFLDVENAYGAVRHEWLTSCLQAARTPPPLLAVLRATLSCVLAHTVMNGHLVLMYCAMRGTVQGCTAAGLQFSISMEPFAIQLSRAL